uniref:RCC1-like domain-containing protein n=1 Tax=Timema shepardi TaxID=629360 RepID=A0A7R9G1D4_TIMSH|nr:unnamed protein product [Timema shepardi]
MNDMVVRTQSRLDGKWLKLDLQWAFNPDGLSQLWNEMVKDCELTGSFSDGLLNAVCIVAHKGNTPERRRHCESGHYYCGLRVLTCPCCDGICGPNTGCNCPACQRLDQEEAARTELRGTTPLPSLPQIDSWTWGPQPSVGQLKMSMRSLNFEQKELCYEAANSTLSATRFRQRLLIAHRYFVALGRHLPPENNHQPPVKSAVGAELRSTKSGERATISLAKVGSRAAMNFSFAFLRRAWRSEGNVANKTSSNHSFLLFCGMSVGEDTDLCSELLTESLDALHSLPEATLFDESSVSPVWLEVVDRSDKFLRQVVLSGSSWCEVPVCDQHTALCIILELAAQRATLGQMLDAVLLLLNLWGRGKYQADNRAKASGTCAPLVPLLKRFHTITGGKSQSQNSSWDDNAQIKVSLVGSDPSLTQHASNHVVSAPLPQMSPTDCFLRYLHLPEDDCVSVDLKQAAVALVSHLDRLAAPYLPPPSFSKVPAPGSLVTINLGIKCTLGQCQEVLAWGWLAWSSATDAGMGPHSCEAIGELEIARVASAERCVHILTTSGKIYMVFYSSETQVSRASTTTTLPAPVAARSNVLLWRYSSLVGCTACPQLVEGLAGKEVADIASHPDGKHYLALTGDGEVYSWGSGDGGRLGHGDSNSREEPTLVQALAGKHVVRVACGSTYSAAITVSGELYTWGRGNYGRLGHGSSDDYTTPTVVAALRGHRVVDVACGSGDAQTLVVTDAGLVFSWGDGDYGKLGKHMVSLAVGSVHVLALTEEGEVYGWGRNDYAQVMEPPTSSVTRPTLLPALKGKVIIGIACGPTQVTCARHAAPLRTGWDMNLDLNKKVCPCPCPQSFAWSSSKNWTISLRVPFVVDVCEETLRMLDQLLGQCEAVIGGDWPPPQDKECMAVACLNLLRLQVCLHAMISHGVDVKSLGLGPSNSLLASLKHHVVQLASAPGVLSTVQCAAQAALQAGWSVLLPTADERASTLSQLLPNTAASAGHRRGAKYINMYFDSRLDCLVPVELGQEVEGKGASHLSDQALFETESKRAKDASLNKKHNSSVPLLHLSRLQAVHGGGALTQETREKAERSPSLNLLLKFQRLLIAQIYSHSDKIKTWNSQQGMPHEGSIKFLLLKASKVCPHEGPLRFLVLTSRYVLTKALYGSWYSQQDVPGTNNKVWPHEGPIWFLVLKASYVLVRALYGSWTNNKVLPHEGPIWFLVQITRYIPMRALYGSWFSQDMSPRGPYKVPGTHSKVCPHEGPLRFLLLTARYVSTRALSGMSPRGPYKVPGTHSKVLPHEDPIKFLVLTARYVSTRGTLRFLVLTARALSGSWYSQQGMSPRGPSQVPSTHSKICPHKGPLRFLVLTARYVPTRALLGSWYSLQGISPRGPYKVPATQSKVCPYKGPLRFLVLTARCVPMRALLGSWYSHQDMSPTRTPLGSWYSQPGYWYSQQDMSPRGPYKAPGTHSKVCPHEGPLKFLVLTARYVPMRALSAQDVLGAETLITKYIYLLSSHVSEILPSAAELAAVSSKHFSYVASVLRGDVIEIVADTGHHARSVPAHATALNRAPLLVLFPDVLLPELLLSLILLQLEAPLLLHHVNWVPLLSPLLDTLDKFNRLAPGGDRDDAEDMAWPGIIAPQHSVPNQKTPEDAPMIRKADLENHNRDGGLWIVINRKVYDVQDFR